MSMDILLHSQLLLASNPQNLTSYEGVDPAIQEHASNILKGNSYKTIERILDGGVFLSGDINNKADLLICIQSSISTKLQDDNVKMMLAIAFLQTFIQNNYTGPTVPLSSHDVIFGSQYDKDTMHNLSIDLLGILGQSAYELCDDPSYLIIALVLLEQLTNQPSLFSHSEGNMNLPEISAHDTPSVTACAHWWRARALLTHVSLISEPVGLQPVIACSILDSINLVYAICRGLPEAFKADYEKKLGVIFYLENIKCSLGSNTEHLCLPSLTKIKKLMNFSFVLTGARAKRTKFQQKGHAGLIILAQSSINLPDDEEAGQNSPESFALNSDLLLERPQFDSIGNEPLDEQIIKKQKHDEHSGYEEDKILPVALRQEDIPIQLKDIDPNDQPQLNNYDNIQLLLRLTTIRQSSPAQNPLVEEELSALVSRVLYQKGSKNWTIFSRALWERSIVETTKAKTIERGLLQMQSLVEELGLKINTRMLPQSSDVESSAQMRLKYIHQLPFLPRWSLDSKLAERYMSVGVLRSAVEIYERLRMWCEAALCYAAVGDEKQAEEIIIRRIEQNPNDARAYSILGDIRQDPKLWEKSWSVGKYVNAKNSLARYYYKPPAQSGLKPDYSTALKHLNDSLRLYPLAFDTWYFYGCIGLECGKMELAAEAFSRCVSLDDTHSLAWSNLSAAYIELGKLKEAHSCLKRAVSSDAQKNWRIWENYMLVSLKLHEWDDVLLACRKLVDIRKNKSGEISIDLPVVEKLVELLVSTDFPADSTARLTHFQSSCMEFICDVLPTVITTSSRCWRLVARVELWRRRPWASLECHEKAYRAVVHNPDLEIDEKAWNECVEACDDLVAAYESLGDREGKYGAGDLVCKDWKYKARSTIKSLMSKGKNSWDGSDGWEKLLELRRQL